MKEKNKMRTEQKTNIKNSVRRLLIVALAVLIQVGWLIVWLINLNENSVLLSGITKVIAIFLVLTIYGRHTNAAIKMPWIILIMAFPVVGICCYMINGRSIATRRMRRQYQQIDRELNKLYIAPKEVLPELEKEDLAIANQCRYIQTFGYYPVYKNTDVEYYPLAEQGLEAQKEAIRQAKKFIFMEYHAIEVAEAFQGIRDILKQKAKEGVEVRVFYDDVGSIGFLNPEFIRQMEADGIQCRVFNPVFPIWNMFMNNRDHRKITVIDGEIGFTGGYNLANEYFNFTHPYGFWKDTGIRLQGEAVRSLTLMFLEMWNAMEHTDTEYEKYLPLNTYQAKEHGFIQPYADSPMDEEHMGENVYMNVIKNAKRYIYFMTPYLIITDEMSRELGLAAKRGVDVRIITPGIPDKKVIYQLTRSYYAGLVMRGVRIFEYTPGFCHAKMCVADDEIAVVGTINLDYRSLYLHFENAALLYHMKVIADIYDDFIQTMKECEEVTNKYSTGRSKALRIGQCILRLFAPLL